MTFRFFYLLKISCLFFLVASCGNYSADNSTQGKPNIIIFYVDDLGWADVGFNGNRVYRTPNNSYEYELKKVKQELPEYLKLETFISEFVVDVYNKNYSGCLELIDFDDKEKFKTVIDEIYEGLNKDYSDTKIVDFNSNGDSYSIYGMIKSKSDQLDLFTMELKKVEDNFEIESFNF